MKPAMYTFLNKGLGMSTGKASAQAQHAAVEAYRLSLGSSRGTDRDGFARDYRPDAPQVFHTDLVDAWYKGGHYMKLVMEATDQGHLLIIERYLNDRGFKTALIIDEGHTEIAPITATALGVEIVDKDDPHTAATFESFRLYKDDRKRPTPPETNQVDEHMNQFGFWRRLGQK